MKEIVYSRAARKTMRRIPRKDAQRILTQIERYAAQSESDSLDVKQLQGRSGLRLRVGDYRIIMDDGVILDVLDIGHRRRIYR